jgi:hypothetical protein
VTSFKASLPVYNLSIAGSHSYVVSPEGLLVHNKAVSAVGGLVNPKVYVQLEKQLARDGASSIHKALRSAERTLQEHVDKLSQMQYKSQVEGTIQNVRNQIETIKQFILDKGL